jgi:glutaredoxin-related protein
MSKSVVVLFLKGSIQCPHDGYQKRAIELLNEMQIRFTWFDVLTDSDVREICKEYSRQNSFP